MYVSRSRELMSTVFSPVNLVLSPVSKGLDVSIPREQPQYLGTEWAGTCAVQLCPKETLHSSLTSAKLPIFPPCSPTCLDLVQTLAPMSAAPHSLPLFSHTSGSFSTVEVILFWSVS